MTGVPTGMLPVLGVQPMTAMPGMTMRPSGGAGAGAPAGTPTTIRFNPSDKAAAAVLSNSNRTITGTAAAGTICAARSVQSYSSGKYYGEMVVDALSGFNNEASFGLATSGTSLTANGSGGSYLQCAQENAAGGVTRLMVPEFSGTITMAAAWYAGGNGIIVAAPATSVFRWALDADAGKIWFGKNSGWFVGDPVAGTDPAGTFTAGSLTLFLWAGCYENTSQWSIPATTNYPAPAGFLVA